LVVKISKEKKTVKKGKGGDKQETLRKRVAIINSDRLLIMACDTVLHFFCGFWYSFAFLLWFFSI